MIYLDNAATTKPSQEAIARANEYLTSLYFNPSSMYKEGFFVQNEMKNAKREILSHIADPNFFDLVITSCGTESNNTAIFGFGKRGNVVTTEGEHSAILSPVNELKNRGIAEGRFAKLKEDGRVDVDDLLSLIDDKTTLVSVMHVNNETGAINDVSEIAKAVKKRNPRVIFHSDGVQAYGKIPFHLPKEVDLYSISAHKLGGLKGVGALIKRKGITLRPFLYGGGQENGLRSGTENTFGIKVLQYAAEEKFKTLDADYQRLKEYKRLLEEGLDKEYFYCYAFDTTSPYIASVFAKGYRGEILQRLADDRGLIIGTGSACSSNAKLRFSKVLIACGIEKQLIDGAIRISFSPSTTQEEVMKGIEILNEIVRKTVRSAQVGV